MRRLSPLLIILATLHATATPAADPPVVLHPIPDRLVVLTFDDASRSHYTIVRPILKQYGFGATFFVTEGFDFKTNKEDYVTWEQIRALHEDGFEIGNHTRDHLGITDKTVGQLAAQLEGIADQCKTHGIPTPVSFAWPGNAFTEAGFDILAEHGIRFARRGGAPEYPYDEGRGFAYEAGLDHPLLVPSAGDARPKWTLPDFIRAVEQAGDGRIAVLQFHGVPDTAHDWVSLGRQNFEACMKYLALHKYEVIAVRDLEKYVNHKAKPSNYRDVIKQRRKQLETDAATR
jgi:peptidoglycan/xylan/chitin deacetylase (PgdA/CDA1 family)